MIGWLLILLVIALLGVLAAYLWMRRREQQTAATTPPPKARADLTVRDADVGDVVTIVGAGDEYEDLQVTIDRKHLYESRSREWFELSGHYRGRRIFIEVEEDDELTVRIDKHREDLGLSDLGLSEEELVALDESGDRGRTIEWGGATWRFAGSSEARFFQRQGAEPEGFYNWDFQETGGDRWLFIEKWEGEPFEGGVTEAVHPGDIRVFRP